MVQSYKLTTDYDWILEQIDNTLWILQKSSKNLALTTEDQNEIEQVFKKIKKKIYHSFDQNSHVSNTSLFLQDKKV